MVLYHIDFSLSWQHVTLSLISRSTQTSQVASQKQYLPGFCQSSMDRKRPLQSLDSHHLRCSQNVLASNWILMHKYGPSIPDQCYTKYDSVQMCAGSSSHWKQVGLPQMKRRTKGRNFSKVWRMRNQTRVQQQFQTQSERKQRRLRQWDFLCAPCWTFRTQWETMRISTSQTPKRVTEDAESVQTMTLENGPSTQRGAPKRMIGY